jgi:ABC-type antimicrobial peptide transport system permease subunit
LTVFGISTGLAVSAVITRFISEMLFHTQPTDPLTFTLPAAVLLVAGLVASGLPAYRAACLDPIQTLRQQ